MENNIEEKLKYIYENVNEWLKFAEAKNGALSVFNGAAIFGVIQSYSNLPEYLKCNSIVFATMAFISLCFNLFSFLPTVNVFFIDDSTLKSPLYHKKREICNSIFHSGHICFFTHFEFLEKVYSYYSIERSETFPQHELDLAHQITTNSQIAQIKYQIFKWSGVIILSAMVLPLPFVIWYLVNDKIKKNKLSNTKN